MKLQIPWKKKKIMLEKDLQAIEDQLKLTLLPILPNPEFIKKLRISLVGKPKRDFLGLSPDKVQKGLLLAGGIASVAMMVVTSVRVVMAILGALGVLQLNKQVKESSPNLPPQSLA